LEATYWAVTVRALRHPQGDPCPQWTDPTTAGIRGHRRRRPPSEEAPETPKMPLK